MHRAPGLPGVSRIVFSPFVFCVLVLLVPRPELVAQVELSATLEGQVLTALPAGPWKVFLSVSILAQRYSRM